MGAKSDNPTPFQSARSIQQGMRFFPVVDALKGYHQCALDTESIALTKFSNSKGLHQYIRLPMGINAAGDDYGRRFSDISSATFRTTLDAWKTWFYTQKRMK